MDEEIAKLFPDTSQINDDFLTTDNITNVFSDLQAKLDTMWSDMSIGFQNKIDEFTNKVATQTEEISRLKSTNFDLMMKQPSDDSNSDDKNNDQTETFDSLFEWK